MNPRNRRSLILSLLAALALGCFQSPSGDATKPAGPPTPDEKALVTGNTAFAVDLYDRLMTQTGNLFFSPHSISTALAMTYGGARGETAAQMAQVLHFTLPPERLHPAFAQLAGSLQPRGCELHVANRLWGQKSYGFLDSFLTLTKTNYGAGLQEVDFVGATEKARRTINAWVEEKTREKIQELIARGILDADTVLVLTNAIYFKGRWKQQFMKEETVEAPFHLLDGGTVQVPLMRRMGDYPAARYEKLQVLELPYEGEELSMIILLPQERGGLPELERALSPETLAKWLSGLRTENLRVMLPRFTVTSKFELAPTLKAMGMTAAFSGADFSGMTGSRELFISNVIHKAFVDVNEEGTEAAAATGVVMKRSVPAEFRADHPFLFLIRDNRTGAILFLGRIANPAG